MTEQMGVKGVFDLSQFNQGIAQYTNALTRATGLTNVANNALNAFGQIGVGALREVGAIATRAIGQAVQQIGRFSAEVLSAAAAQSPLVDTLGSLKQGLIDVTSVSFAPIFESLNGLVQRAAPAFLGVVQAAQTSLGGIAQNAFAWGENITAQFANGIIAAVGAVFDALASIGNAVASMLMPGSPPALLPDLDHWGTEAAQVYLDGWGQADFGVFQQIGNTLTGLIRSIPGASGAGIIGQVLGTRQGVAQAVEELRAAGEITDATMRAITSSVGTAGSAVTAYLQALNDSTAASKAVQDAQEQVNRLTAEYNELLRPIEEELAGIDEAQRQLSEDQKISQFELVANDPNATLAEKEMARLEIQRIRAARNQRAIAAEKKAELEKAGTVLDAAKEQEKQAADELKAREALIALITEQNRLLEEQRKLAEQAGGGGGGGGGAPRGGGIRPIGISPIGIDFDSLFGGLDEKLANVQAAFASAWAAIVTTLQPAIAAFGNVQVAFGNLVSAFVESGPMIQLFIADMVRFVVEQMGTTLPTAFNNLASALNSLADIWRAHGDTIMGVVNFAFRFIVATIASSMTAISGLIAIVLNTISGVWDSATLALEGRWQEAFANILQFTLENMALAQDTISAILNSILLIADTNLSEFTAIWTNNLNMILSAAKQSLQLIDAVIITALLIASNAINEFFSGLISTWQNNWDMLLTIVSATWNSIDAAADEAIGRTLGNLINAAGEFASVGEAMITGMVSGIINAAGSLATAAANAASGALTAAASAIGAQSPSTKAREMVGVPFVQGIAQGITSQMGALNRTVQSASTGMLTTASSSVSYSSSYAPQFTYAPTYNSAPAPVSENFAIMRALAG